MAVSDWSTTAAENTTVDSISIGEHCPIKNLNDAIRSVMADVKTKTNAIDDTLANQGFSVVDGKLCITY